MGAGGEGAGGLFLNSYSLGIFYIESKSKILQND